MVTLGPLATGILEGTLLALLGLVLFRLRHKAGLIPYVFLIGGLALTIPFTTHLTPLQLQEPWTVSRAYAIVLPVLVTLVLLLHILVGSVEARTAAALPVLGGGLVAAATMVSTAFPVVIPDRFLPSATEAIATGALVAVGALAATALFEWWHRHVARAPPFVVFVTSSLAGVLAHGAAHEASQLAGLALPGGGWPAVVAVPLVAGAAPVVFVGVYAEVVLGDLAPVAGRRSDRDDTGDRRDLERYRRAQARLREAMAWVQEATAEQGEEGRPVDAGFLVADPDGRVLHATDPVGWMLGRANSEVIGSGIGDLFGSRNGSGTVPSGSDPELWEGTHRTRVQRPDGSQRILSVSFSRTSSGALRGAVEDRTAAVARTDAERHRERARCAIGVLTRDVPNLLAAPRSQAERLAEIGCEDRLPERAARLARQVHDGLLDVQDALERARLLADLDEPPDETLDLAGTLRQAVQGLPQGMFEGMAIRWRTPDAEALVRAPPGLEVAIEELLTNAFEHGGPEVQTTIGLDRRDGSWVATFDDDGPGVPDELKTRIFDGFRREGPSRSAGLGLTLARAIVEAAGGQVWVEDRIPGEPQHGASFRVSLPAADRRASSEAPLDGSLASADGTGTAGDAADAAKA